IKEKRATANLKWKNKIKIKPKMEVMKMKKKYVAPEVVEFGNASDIVKGCGGWGCEVYLRNWSYRMQGGKCVDAYKGEAGDC
ncbi:hypothetical protein, partial [Bacillus luti]